jgi:predicted nucleic acid-binding protein
LIVVDASALVEALLVTGAHGQISERLFDSGESLHAPHVIDVEAAQVIRWFEARGDIGEARAREAVEDLRAFPLRRHPHLVLLPRIWELRANLTAYDAAYVALAEALDASLLTRDRRLAAAPGHRARVEVI